tara:strand:+ start:1314 stop:2192 length:879 start_codon:yes stop_codon:yes gene_type:complete
MTIYGQDCFIGMKIKVDDRGNCSWQPNKFAGNHGARFSLVNDGGIGKAVISKYAKGANVRITRDGCLHFRTKDGIESLKSKFNPQKISIPPFDLVGDNLSPGMIMTGPLDGEMHHWFNGKVWTRNIHGKRCHWKQIPTELESALNRFKPEGGSFVITCWGNIAALIQPKPLPPEAREQWSKLAEEEKRLLQIKQKSIQMLPIFLGKFSPEWQVALEDPVDYSKPISDDEMAEMDNFLSQYGIGEKSSNSKSKEQEIDNSEEKSEDVPELEEWADEDESFFGDGLELLYSPGE